MMEEETKQVADYRERKLKEKEQSVDKVLPDLEINSYSDEDD